jgi:DNA-binding LytR/AlgR family response regulator
MDDATIKYKCIIVDDEQLAREMLAVYASRIPSLEVVAKCKNAAEVEAILREQKVDILLSDIEMPLKSGIDLISELEDQPKVIFTTAYQQYALKGYELEVVDYLLKPIGFERFAKAMQKAIQQIETERKAKAFEIDKEEQEQFLMVKEGYHQHKLFLSEILYIEAMREYVVYHKLDGKLMELRSISKLEQVLPEERFLRVHRSFIVVRSEIKSWHVNKIKLSNTIEIPIGKTYRKKVKSHFE